MHEAALISVTLEPKTPADAEKLTAGLRSLAAGDPALRIEPADAAGALVVSGVSDLHLEIVIHRLAHEFEVSARASPPRIAYREALTCPADGEWKHAMQAEGRGEYAHVKVHVYPAEPESGYVFQNGITEGAIPADFIAAVDAGVRDAVRRGVLAGYPIDNARIELYDGSYHDVDSSAQAFRIAGARAFLDAASKAGPVLIEPIMHVDALAPFEFAADVAANLVGRGGRILTQTERNGRQVVSARVALSQMFGYSIDLRERTRGRGTFAMRFDRYEPVPHDDEGDRGSYVGAPRRPVWPPKPLRAAVPEPESDIRDG